MLAPPAHRFGRSLTGAAPWVLLAALTAQSPGLNYLILDGDQDWPRAEQPIPLGSLVKPFTTVAWADVHGPDFPEVDCDGQTCWLPAGHGRLGLEEALSHSCNAYFRELARNLTPDEVARAALRFGLPGPPPDASPDALFGLGDAWRAPPEQIARAYSELARRRADPVIARTVDGLGRAAREGTASEARVSRALAKTGTAPCIHSPKGAADGYAILLYPAEKPRYTSVVQLHGHTGREAARAAGELLRHKLEP